MEEISSKSRLTATLLAVFLGVFGAHRIYLEKTLSAVGCGRGRGCGGDSCLCGRWGLGLC